MGAAAFRAVVDTVDALTRISRFADFDDQVQAWRRAFASDTEGCVGGAFYQRSRPCGVAETRDDFVRIRRRTEPRR